ncbi:hypothetical protein GCM10009788_10600 [Nocardioides humi]|uniref:Uncharacterized protein n=1 Tax=Nocardioides humi TaxID=449461 RepID=A0ABN1ZZP9_9ACTN
MDRIAAVDGPTFARPAKKSSTEPTVLISTSAASHPQPAAPKPRSGMPRTVSTASSAPVAPVQTSAARATGGVPAVMRSPITM